MALWNRRKDHKPWRQQQHNSFEHPSPPPGPPTRIISQWGGETQQSIRDREDWQTYMAGCFHGLSVALSQNKL